jgi:PhzF family phenazine biosynthesis protein
MKTFIVDAFTNEAFKGNPAGVCLMEDELKAEKMLLIAQELGFSETAFLIEIGASVYALRFFSPKMEIPLCGHATLAASSVIFEETQVQHIHFINIQNLDLFVRKFGNEIIMEFPVYTTIPQHVPAELLNALGVDEMKNSEYNAETRILLVEIPSTDVLRKLSPDFSALQKSHDNINGVLVTARSTDDDFDFHSRYFWPWSGTDEDPVTGGTHTFLAPYWSKRLGKKIMRSFQSSKRSGFMEVEILSNQRLLLKGQAVTVFAGELRV